MLSNRGFSPGSQVACEYKIGNQKLAIFSNGNQTYGAIAAYLPNQPGPNGGKRIGIYRFDLPSNPYGCTREFNIKPFGDNYWFHFDKNLQLYCRNDTVLGSKFKLFSPSPYNTMLVIVRQYSDPLVIDLSEYISYPSSLLGYYEWDNFFSCCSLADPIKMEILAAIFSAKLSGVKILPTHPYDANKIRSLDDFLMSITVGKNCDKKKRLLTSCWQYGLRDESTSKSYARLLEKIKKENQNIFNNNNIQIFNKNINLKNNQNFNNNIINQYNKNKQIHLEVYNQNNNINYNNAQNMQQQNALPTEQQVKWTKWCMLPYQYQNYTIRYGDFHGKKYFALINTSNNNVMMFNICNTPFILGNGKYFYVSAQGVLLSHNGYYWQPMTNVDWQIFYQQNYPNNYNNMNGNIINQNYNFNNQLNKNMIYQNNNQEVILGTMSFLGQEFKIFGRRDQYGNNIYTKILYNGQYHDIKTTFAMQTTAHGNVQFIFDSGGGLPFMRNANGLNSTWQPNPSLNNNFYNNQNNINNFNKNYGNNMNKFNNNFNITQPNNAAAVEQGQVGVYDDDVKELINILNQAKKTEDITDKDFSIMPEDDGKESICKGNKVLFVGEFDDKNCKLKSGRLNLKFQKDDDTGKDEPIEYYEGKFKNNLYEDENGKYVFAERYNTGIQERFEGSFSQGKPHGQVTFHDANGLPSEYEYDHGKIISIEGFRDMHDTDVIVFDAAISFQDAYTDRYANNFHIVAQEVYDKKKEELFGKGYDAVKMPIADENPTPQQKKMMDFIQKYILVNFNGKQDYRSLCDEFQPYDIIGSSDRMRKMKKEFFGNTNKSISDLIGNNAELRKKWLCFVVDSIGMHVFNKMYAMKNLKNFVKKIQGNRDKKLKVVFSNHGSSSLALRQDHDVFPAEWVSELMETIAFLKRDTYVVNKSCYGGEKLDKKSFSKRIFNVEDLYINNYKSNKIVSNELMEKLQKIKGKYKNKLEDFKQLMNFKESISFASNCNYMYNNNTINYELDGSLKEFMFTLFGIQEEKGTIVFHNNDGQQTNIITTYKQKYGFSTNAKVTLVQKRQLNGGTFLTDNEVKLYDEILNKGNGGSIDFKQEFHEFYDFLKEKEETSDAEKCTIAQAEQEFVKQRLEKKCNDIGIDYQQFEEFEKDFKELIDEGNKTFYKWENEFNNKLDESIFKFLEKNSLLDPLDKLKMDSEKKIAELEDADESPSDDKISQTIKYIGQIIRETKDKITNCIDKVLKKLKRGNYQNFIQNNFKDLYGFCVNNKKIKFENIFNGDGLISKQNLIQLFSNAKQTLADNLEKEKNNIANNLRVQLMNQKTLKKKLMLLKQQKGFGKKIVYSKNLSGKMVHYTQRKQSPLNHYVSNSECYMMYYIIDNNKKMIPIVKDVDGFKQKLKEFEEELEKVQKFTDEDTGRSKHTLSTISNQLRQEKFKELREYINEAKGNKNIILGYQQPKGLEGFTQTVDENGNAIINNTKTDINSLHDINYNVKKTVDLKNENYNEQNKEVNESNNKSNYNSVEDHGEFATVLPINNKRINELQKQPQDGSKGKGPKDDKKKKDGNHDSVYSQYAKEHENEKVPKDNLTNVNEGPEDTKKSEDVIKHCNKSPEDNNQRAKQLINDVSQLNTVSNNTAVNIFK